MKHKLFLILAATLMVCACENKVDDRLKPTKYDVYSTAWVLGVQVTKIPQEGKFYYCQIPGHDRSIKYLTKDSLPYYYRLDGGQMIDRYPRLSDQVWMIHGQYIKLYSLETQDTAPSGEPLVEIRMPYWQELDSLKFPGELRFTNNGIEGKVILKYVD